MVKFVQVNNLMILLNVHREQFNGDQEKVIELDVYASNPKKNMYIYYNINCIYTVYIL